MLGQLLSGNFSREYLISLLLSIPVILFSLSFHEAAHGYIAYKMGDPTARNLGRLTLNPIKHLDPIGTLCMLFFGYGWANPVPINTRNFNNPKKGMALTALAGPVSNFLIAIVCVILYSAMYSALKMSALIEFFFNHESAFTVYTIFYQLFNVAAYMNVTLAVFNLIPLPPFDGSRIFLSFLPPKYYFGIMKYERYILIAALIIFYMGILDAPLNFITNAIIRLFNLIFGTIFGIGG